MGEWSRSTDVPGMEETEFMRKGIILHRGFVFGCKFFQHRMQCLGDELATESAEEAYGVMKGGRGAHGCSIGQWTRVG